MPVPVRFSSRTASTIRLAPSFRCFAGHLLGTEHLGRVYVRGSRFHPFAKRLDAAFVLPCAEPHLRQIDLRPPEFLVIHRPTSQAKVTAPHKR